MTSKKTKPPPLPIGLIGVGSIGSYVARSIVHGEVKGMTLAAVGDIAPLPDELLKELRIHDVSVVNSFSSLLDFPIKLVVECANQDVVRECAGLFLSHGIDLVVMSISAFVDQAFFSDIAATAKEKGCRIYLPSGAVGAIDALRAASLQGLEEVTLTTRKPPKSLGKIEVIDLDNLTEPRVIYEGKATEAVVKFPQNVNVAATISLAAMRPEKTRVRVVADPTIDRNIHEIQARGAFGSFEIRMANNPSPQNPKTSFLAALSLVSLLKRIGESVQIGS